MAVPRLRVPSQQQAAPGPTSDEVELYHRTYTTLLRSSGETLVRVLEPSHRSMNSSLHPLAASEDLDLGAFLYATRRLPDEVADAKVIVMGQEAIVFKRAGIGPIEDWEALEAPARRRRWSHDGDGLLAVLLASASDLDDLIPTLVAYQIEWNKLRVKLRSLDWPKPTTRPRRSARRRSAAREEDWSRLREAWGADFGARLRDVNDRRQNLRVRMLGGSAVGYARMTRRWWRPVRRTLHELGARGPPALLRLLQPALDRQPADRARRAAASTRSPTGSTAPTTPTSSPSSTASAPATPRARGRTSSTSRRASTSPRHPEDSDIFEQRSREERAVGVTHLSSRTALRVSAQVIELDRLDPAALDPRLGVDDAEQLAAARP